MEKIKTFAYPDKFLWAIENFPSRRNENSEFVLVSEKMDFQFSNDCLTGLEKFLQPSKRVAILYFRSRPGKAPLLSHIFSKHFHSTATADPDFAYDDFFQNLCMLYLKRRNFGEM